MIVFLGLGITGVVKSADDAVPLLFLEFLGIVAAGYVAARLAARDHVLHGGLAGLALFVIATGIALAADPASINILVIAFTGLVASVLGSAGGALARAVHS